MTIGNLTLSTYKGARYTKRVRAAFAKFLDRRGI